MTHNEFETELKSHSLRYQDYVELGMLGLGNSKICPNCNKKLEPLTYMITNSYKLPCWNCVGSERIELVGSVEREIKDYYNRVLGDRYLQLFLIDPIYFESTLTHSYDGFKEILGCLSLPSRKDIWFVDWELGYPRTICKENLNGIKIVNLSRFYKIESSQNLLKVNDITVCPPEIVEYGASKHRSRFDVLNPKSERLTKRLRLGTTNECIKFYKTSSIFQLNDEEGIELEPDTLNKLGLLVVKLSLLRNKTYTRKIFEIIYNCLPSIGVFNDKVFLKNRVVCNPTKDLELVFTWLPEKVEENKINISIL